MVTRVGTHEVGSYCRMCPALCGVVVTVEDGVAVRLVGDPNDPVSRGYVCPKGRKMVALTDDANRLNQPLIRNASGRLVAVDWETALDDLAERLSNVIDEAGAYGVGLYVGTMFDTTGRWAATRLMAELGSPSTYTSLTVDCPAKILVSRLMAGKERIWPNTDFESTTLLLILGENMVVSHGGYSYVPDPIRYLRDVARRGEVWVVDPRRTETARHATHHLTPRSGTDYAVLAHVVREVLADGADTEYVAAHTHNVDRLRDAVARFDAPITAAITGIAVDDLRTLVAAVRRHGRLAVVTGTGISMAAAANVAEWMAFALQIVTGSFERPGGRWFNHGATFDPSKPVALETSELVEPGPRTRPDIPRLAGQYPCAQLPAEIGAGHVRALLVAGGNPMTAFPQPERLGASLGKLDALAVWDLVPNATTEHATHMFPCPDGFERPDLKIPIHLPAVYAQYTPQVVPRRADRRSMWRSLTQLGARLGVSVFPDGTDPDELTDDDVLGMQVAGTPVDWDDVRTAGRPVSSPRVDNWVVDHVLPGGRWDLAPEPLVDQMGGSFDRPAHDLVLGNRREVRHTNSLLTREVDGTRGPEPFVYAHPVDAEHAGVTDGGWVEVTSAHGALRARLRIDENVTPGVVAVPHGFDDPNVGHLTATDADLDPLTGMPTLVGVPVALRTCAPT